jgi:glycosyltransferase involved in cell wall biosynthesis
MKLSSKSKQRKIFGKNSALSNMSEVKEKIGIGIVTCNRQHYLEKLLESVADCNWAEFIIVNDGDKLELPGYNYYIHNNEKNLGVGKSKNIAMKHLMDKGCDYIFIIEDDMVILDEYSISISIYRQVR